MRTLLLLVLFAIYKFSFANDFTLIARYDHIKGFVAIDRLDNIYSIENGVLLKLDEKGTVLKYSNRRFGAVTHVDVRDPLNIMVFFRNFGVIAFLDRNLTEKNIFQATDLHEFDIPRAVCASSQGGFWVYYANTFRLVRYNSRGVPEVNSIDLNQKIPAFNAPVWMLERDERLFMTGKELMVFDLFANFLFRIPEVASAQIQVSGNIVYYLNNNMLYTYDLQLNETKEITLPAEHVHSFFLLGDVIYLQTDSALEKYRYKENFQ
jgi:hypothetical protein